MRKRRIVLIADTSVQVQGCQAGTLSAFFKENELLERYADARSERFHGVWQVGEWYIGLARVRRRAR